MEVILLPNTSAIYEDFRSSVLILVFMEVILLPQIAYDFQDTKSLF